MGMFDQAARQAAKIDPPGYFHWLFGLADPPLVFRGWLDPRRLPSAGAADLTGDAVADFDDRTAPAGRFALVLEMQTEPDADVVERLALYTLGLRLELRDATGKRRVGAAVVNLPDLPLWRGWICRSPDWRAPASSCGRGNATWPMRTHRRL